MKSTSCYIFNVIRSFDLFSNYSICWIWKSRFLATSISYSITNSIHFSLATSPFSPTIDPVNLDRPVTVNGATDNIDAEQIKRQLETISVDQQSKE